VFEIRNELSGGEYLEFGIGNWDLSVKVPGKGKGPNPGPDAWGLASATPNIASNSKLNTRPGAPPCRTLCHAVFLFL